MHILLFFSWVSLRHHIEISSKKANGSVKWFLFGKCSLEGILGLTSDKPSALKREPPLEKWTKLKSDVYVRM